MSLTKSRLGLILILAGVVLARIAARISNPALNATPETIWHSMTPGLKSMVLLGWLFFVVGCWKLLQALAQRIRSHKSAM